MAPPRRGELSPEEKELLRVIATGGPRPPPPAGKGRPHTPAPALLPLSLPGGRPSAAEGICAAIDLPGMLWG